MIKNVANKILATLKRQWRLYNVFLQRGNATSPMPDETATCLYCGHDFQGNYCPRCGQPNHLNNKRKKTQKVIKAFREAYPQLSSEFFRTLLHLLTRPGYMIRDFFEGHRVIYMGPLKTMVVALSINFLCIGIANQLDAIDVEESSNGKTTAAQVIKKRKNPAIIFDERGQKAISDCAELIGIHLPKHDEYKKGKIRFFLEATRDFLSSVGLLYLIFHFPILSISSSLAFRKYRMRCRKLKFSEHYIIFIYLYSFLSFQILPLGANLFYFVWTYKAIYSLSWWNTVKRSLVMILWSILFFFIFLIPIIIFYALIFSFM